MTEQAATPSKMRVFTVRAPHASVEASEEYKGQAWGVVLDIDETTLDNSDYQKRTGGIYSDTTWSDWVAERRATVLPGVRNFTHYVHDDLHEQVVLITSRLTRRISVGKGIRMRLITL